MTNMPITLATVGTYDGVTVADGTLGRTPGQPGMEKVWCALRLMPRLDSQHFDGCRLGFAEDSWIKAYNTRWVGPIVVSPGGKMLPTP